MSKISRFTSNVVQLVKNAVGGGFAEYAVVSPHYLRVYLENPTEKHLIC